ncbi:MAG: glutamate-1-semialdehyde 2,1-aminomutase [Candidatus Neptunochlamydia sp.]|nr:glutamate-1-semialdehyde 2,1-aminomutase [Candidatus Neptunochlamydia sp.]
MITIQRTNSKEIFEKSKKMIPGGVNSPVRAFIGFGIDPMIVKEGKGDMITDVDGQPYIDYCMSWGALLHGHTHEEVTQRAIERTKFGTSFGIATEEELKLAEELIQGVSSLEKVRFVSSGTEAVMTAIRLVRGYTRRSIVIKFNGNYHGHADSLLVKAGSGVCQVSQESSSEGVPEEVVKHTFSLPYNDCETFKEVMHDPFYSQFVAGVVLEPIGANMGVVSASAEFLKCLREETRRIGAVLIFDEVISGFRVSYGGAQKLYGIEPDLSCFGKIIGGGFPAAAFGGRKEIMDCLAPKGKVYQAGTLSGNPVAMEAGLATLEIAKRPGFYEELRRKTEIITKPLLGQVKGGCLQEAVGMFTLFFGVEKVSSFEDLVDLDKERFKAYFQFMWHKGIYISPSPYEACFISSAHTDEHLEKTRDAILEFLRD